MHLIFHYFWFIISIENRQSDYELNRITPYDLLRYFRTMPQARNYCEHHPGHMESQKFKASSCVSRLTSLSCLFWFKSPSCCWYKIMTCRGAINNDILQLLLWYNDTIKVHSIDEHMSSTLGSNIIERVRPSDHTSFSSCSAFARLSRPDVLIKLLAARNSVT